MDAFPATAIGTTAVATVAGVQAATTGAAPAPSPSPSPSPSPAPRHAAARENRPVVDELLIALVEQGGSDLHLTVDSPPMIRVHGDLRPLPGEAPLTPLGTMAIIRTLLSDEQWERFETHLEIDIAYDIPGVSRFRVNCFQQRNSYGAVMRAIPHEIKPLHELGVPSSIERFAYLPRGLVLVTGPTGSGKTTTLASLLDLANSTRRDHIVTIEDPIEFLHPHRRCIVNQREVGVDTSSFSEALKRVLRQDPDIILVGELRDLETVSTALTAAETGHLVLATLHTQSAAQTIDRVIDIFPAHQQQEIRAQLSTALQGVLTQALVRKSDGSGRAVVCEVMFATPAIRNLIREGKNHQIPSFMQSSGADGMLTFDQDLAAKVIDGSISYAQGLELAHERDEFARLAGRR